MYAPPIAPFGPFGPFGPYKMAERVVRPRRQLRAGITQLACVLAGIALGLALPRIDGGLQVQSARAIEMLGFVALAVAGIASVILERYPLFLRESDTDGSETDTT